MPADLKGKVALITGASSGIGAATAIHFAKCGCSLTIAGRIVENLEATKSACVKAGAKPDNVMLVIGDITDDEHRQKLIVETLGKFGKLDILVNNAGIGVRGEMSGAPIEDYDRVMDVNVRSVICLTQLCIPSLIKTKGAIVNVSSINGPKSFPGVGFYCISKAALDQFTKCLALELALKGVRVNSANPGVIVTDIHRRMGLNPQEYEKFLENTKHAHALGRVGEPEEVAKAIAFLASDDSSFTTGELLPIDGGRGIMTPR